MRFHFVRWLYSKRRTAAVSFLTLALAATVNAQWLERTVHLPDSLAVGRALRIAYNQSLNTVYVAGEAGRVLALDASTNQKLGYIEAGYGVEAILCNPQEDKVYIANHDDSTVTIIDCLTNTRIATLGVGAGPTDLAFSSLGNKVYCANEESNDITVIDGATDAVLTTVPTGVDPMHMAYDSTNNKVFVTCMTSSELVVIDAGVDTVLARIPTNRVPEPILWNPQGNKLYHSLASSPSDSYICIRDAAAHDTITVVRAGMGPEALCLNNTDNKVYAMNSISGDVTVIDCAGDSLLTTIDAGEMLYDIVYVQGANKVYCSRLLDVVVIDASTDIVVDSVWIGNRAAHMAVSEPESKVYCAAEDVAVIDCVSDTLFAAIEIWASPVWPTWNAAHNTVYCPNSRSPANDVFLIDGTTFEVAGRIPVQGEPSTTMLNESVDKLYCGTSGDSAVLIVDCTVNALSNILYFPLGYRAVDFASNTAGDKVYSANGPGNSVSVIDAYSDSVIVTIPVGPLVYTLLWYPPGNKLYCAAVDTIAVIDGVADSLLRKIPVPGFASDFAWNSTNDRIYFANDPVNEVGVLDPTGDTLVNRLSVGQNPVQIVWNSTDNKMYSADLFGGGVSVIDCGRDTVIASIPITEPRHLLWNHVSDKVYCTGRTEDLVIVIDGVTDNIVQTIPVGRAPGGMCLDPDGNRVYVANCRGSSISIIKDVVGVQEEGMQEPLGGRPFLQQNLPNPLRQSTLVRYSLPVACFLNLGVYDVSGRLVENLVDKRQGPGTYEVRWHARHRASGIYFCRLQAGDFTDAKKMTLVR